MPKAVPIIKTSEFNVVNGHATCNVEIFLPYVKLCRWLELYITTDISMSLSGSSVQKIEYLKGDQTSPWGKSRILHELRMGKNLPFIFDADVQQTVWDYGNGRGQILVAPLNGFISGYIAVDLQETFDKDGVPGVLGKFNLEHLNIRSCDYIHISSDIYEEITQFIPILRMFNHIPSEILNVIGYVPLMITAEAIVSYALKIPCALFELHQKSLRQC